MTGFRSSELSDCPNKKPAAADNISQDTHATNTGHNNYITVYIVYPSYQNYVLTGGTAMKNQQTFSHGLLYSVAPDHFSALRLLEEEGKDEFDWEAYETELAGDSLMRVVLNFLKTTAVMWGMIKLH